MVAADAPLLMGRACECFIRELTLKGYEICKDARRASLVVCTRQAPGEKASGVKGNRGRGSCCTCHASRAVPGPDQDFAR